MTPRLLLFPVALVAAAALAQELPTPPPKPAGVRLTYELPVDALMRSLKATPDKDLEQLLAETIATIGRRLGATTPVRRHEATGFTVDVPDASARAVVNVRRLVETVGRLEMRILANADYGYEGADLGMPVERARLRRWLEDGGLVRVLADPAQLADYTPGSPNVRWVVHRVEPDGERWRFALAQVPDLEPAVVPLFAAETFRDGPKAKGAPDRLVELVALNLHEEHFDQGDLAPGSIRLSRDRNGGHALNYALQPERAAAYRRFTHRNVGHACAIVIDGELLSAPVFRSAIPGRGIIEGSFDQAEAEALAAALATGALPAPPRLVARQPLPTNGR